LRGLPASSAKQYHLHMRVATGTVISGKVVLDGPVIADGTDVYVLTRGASDAAVLSDEELAELEAGLAEADQGDVIAGDAFLAQLRRHG
jgi:hypothetical protein